MCQLYPNLLEIVQIVRGTERCVNHCEMGWEVSLQLHLRGSSGPSASDPSETLGAAGAELGGLNLTGLPRVWVREAFWPEGAWVAVPLSF